jgi:eukaryotic-like serine/threonine-protein kinase
MTLLRSTLILAAVVFSGCDRKAVQDRSVPRVARHITVAPITNMVLVKAGTFLRQGRPTTIAQDFWIGKFEVTQSEYAAVTGRNPSHFKDRPNCPVEKVSFNDARDFCASLTERERAAGRLPNDYNYRLPSEAEWEYACLAGSTNKFSFGQTPEEAHGYAWTAENSDATTHPVGQKRPNAWGLHDMHGNVWEWSLDSFKPEPGKPAPPQATKGELKIFKGGGWNQDAEFAGAPNRFMMSPSNGIHFVGFRIILVPTQPR